MKRIVWAAAAVAAVSIALAVYNLPTVGDWYCKGKETVATLRLGGERKVIITTDRCFENDARAVYYRVEDGARTVVPTTYFGTQVEWRDELAAVYAEGGQLVGVVATTPAPPVAAQPLVIIMQDFRSGENWPRERDDETPCGETIKARGRELYERLKRENPGLPLPADYCR